MAKRRTRTATCGACGQTTEIPAETPAFGTALVCSHCHGPLISTMSKSGLPLSTPAGVVRKHTGFSGRCLIHPTCPHCGKTNYCIVAPASGRETPWAARPGVDVPGAFAVSLACIECGEPFVVEWDEPPLPMACALCRTDLHRARRATVDPRFCVPCGEKLARVQPRRRDTHPPGRAVTAAFIVGFSAMPRPRTETMLRRSDRDLKAAPDANVGRLMLSGGMPRSEVEQAMVAVQVAQGVVAKALGGPVDLSRVSYQPARNAIVLKVWA
jgi:hypothetical protein